MEWKFTDDAPIYQQIMNIMKQQIASGELTPGQKLSSVREMALEAGVNIIDVFMSEPQYDAEGNGRAGERGTSLFPAHRGTFRGRTGGNQRGIKKGIDDGICRRIFRQNEKARHQRGGGYCAVTGE